MNKAVLYILCGYPFSGKSTLVKEIVKQKDFTLVGLDEINHERGLGFHGKPVTTQDWTNTYQEAYRRIGQLLGKGQSVIYDATNFTTQQREEPKEIAKKNGAIAKVIFIDVSKDVAMQRWQENRKINSRFDVKDEDFAQVVDNFQKPTDEENVLVYDQTIPVKKWIEKNLV